MRLLLFCLLAFNVSIAQIRVSPNQRYLMTTDGKPFFWLGDTAWELFRRLTREEAEEYLELRKQQGYNVIHAVALAEMNGLRQPNRYGDLPLIEEDPTRLAITLGANPANETEYDYWDHVDFIINRIAYKGMYVGLLPTWGDKVAHMWGDGPIVFNEANAEVYGAALANRYKNNWNIIWILGGDRPATYKFKVEGIEQEFDDRDIWRAMAKGIESVLGKDAFITYHPMGGTSSSAYFHADSWLDLNAFQSGHGARETEVWDWVTRDLSMKPQKPTLDMEPCYEDHPVNPWDGKWTRAERGYFNAYDVRARIYRSVFAGGSGITYGHHQIWQFLNTDLNPAINIGDTVIGWQKAMKAEAATQMQHLKRLMLARPYFDRVEDQSLIAGDRGVNYTDLIVATRHEKGLYAFVYLPDNKPVLIDLSKLSGSTKSVSWFDPRTGKTLAGFSTTATGVMNFIPPQEGKDWVLIIDDASQNFPKP